MGLGGCAVLLEVLEHSSAVVVQVRELDGDSLPALQQRAPRVRRVVAHAVQHGHVPAADRVSTRT